MNQTTKRRAAGMIAVNAQLSAIAGQPSTLKQLLACFKTSAVLRRAWKIARAGLAEPEQPAQLAPILPPARAPQPAQLPEQLPEQQPAPAQPAMQWGPGTWKPEIKW